MRSMILTGTANNHSSPIIINIAPAAFSSSLEPNSLAPLKKPLYMCETVREREGGE